MNTLRIRGISAFFIVLFAAVGIAWSSAGASAGPNRSAALPAKAHQHAFLTAISFSSGQDGWVAGHTMSHGYIFHTTNSGKSWTRRTVGWAAEQLQFINASDGWAVVENPARCGAGTSPPRTACLWAIVSTHDAGNSWALQLNGGACWQISSMDFITNQEGWAIESNSPCIHGNQKVKTKIVVTTNGGGTWQIAFQPSQRVTSVHFGAPLNGWAAADGLTGGKVDHCKTIMYDKSDRGQTWGEQLFVSGYCSGQVDFVNARDGWLFVTNVGACSMNGCFDNRLYRTTNGGNQWTIEQQTHAGKPLWSGSCGFLQQPHFTGPNTGYVPVSAGPSCPSGGIDITRDGGRHWVRKQPRGFQVSDLSPVSTADVWAIGCAERTLDCTHVLHTTDAAHSWGQLRVD
ncbi:MAG TPA: hypothetical protein VG815_03225 [Chloroflexota bacterium]|jgi:hypothetical protein|nr:hypothetical protein [Chloroflexota bacterium]